jgi:hypothetical protein
VIGSVLPVVIAAAVAASAPIAQGDKARLTLHDGQTLTCAVLESDATTLRVRRWTRVPETPFDVPWSDVASVKRSLGTARGKGARRGALIGGGIGLAYGLLGITGVIGPPPEESDDELCAGVSCLVLATIPPAILGAAVGFVVPREGWEPAEPAVTRPARRGLSVTFRF